MLDARAAQFVDEGPQAGRIKHRAQKAYKVVCDALGDLVRLAGVSGRRAGLVDKRHGLGSNVTGRAR